MQGNALLPLMVFLPMLGAVPCYLLGRRSKRGRDAAVLLVCAAQAILCGLGLSRVLRGETLRFTWAGFCGLGAHFALDGFRAVYLMIAAFMWLMTQGLFAPAYFARHYRNRNRYYFFTLLTLGATSGVFLGSDLYTCFVFFEVMSLTSYVWVAHDETAPALRAAATYLAVAIIGGMVTLMGLFLLWHDAGTLEIARLHEAASALPRGRRMLIASLILVGFAAKAGAFPLHIWLPKAHPVAPAPASALLSGMLTKTGLFGVLALSANWMRYDPEWGNAMLALGAVTMFAGALLALFSVDLKRTLACSSMSQVGFVLAGVGASVLLGGENGLAAHGALLHMVNHSLIKLVLFMAAGAVYMKLHKLNLNDIRGFGRKKPLLHFAFLMGALSISGVPLGSGYISKSLIHEGLLETIALVKARGGAWLPYKAVELLFLFTGGMTACYMTKLYICLFWEKNEAKTQAQFDGMGRYPLPARAALLVSALVLPALGLFPQVFMTGMGRLMQGALASSGPEHAVAYFSGENLLGAAKSLTVGAALYLLAVRPLLMKKDAATGVRVYVNRWPGWLDLEELLYRPLLTRWLPGILGGAAWVMDHLADWGRACLVGAMGALARCMDALPEALHRVLGAVSTFAVRVMDEGVDAVAVGLWRTLFRPRKERARVPVGNRFTWALGRAADGICALLNRTVLKRRPIDIRFEYVFAAGFEELSAGLRRASFSVSFGLLLLCIGLYLAFAYLLR